MLLNSSFDKSYKSIDYLKKKVESLFPEKALLFFPDDLSEDPRRFKNTKEVVNIILFGSFCRSLLESSFWDIAEMRFYVLCQSVKDVMVSIYGFNGAQISVIPRPLLTDAITVSDIDLKKGYHFVYSGRINQNKNIETVISFVHELQTRGVSSRLTLIGPVDEDSKLVYGSNTKIINYEERLQYYIDSFEWENAPEMISEKGMEEWIDFCPKNPILINLSTSMYEDFGVSIAQAMARGWPLLLSDWGGHRDVSGKNILKIPYELLPQMMEFEIKGRMIASFFLENNFGEIASDTSELSHPLELMKEQLAEIRNSVFETYGSSLYLVTRDHWDDFYLTMEGIRFINKYRACFYRKPGLDYICIITNDYYHDDSLVDKINGFLQNTDHHGVMMFGVHELISPDVMRVLVTSRKVYTTLEQDKIPQQFKELVDMESI